MTSVELARGVRERIAEHAARAHPEEACGLLIGHATGGRVGVQQALPCRNHAPAAERRRRFEIEPRAVLNVQRELRGSGRAIIGFYHSHPDGSTAPSATDLRYLRLWPETAWLIAGVGSEAGSPLRAWWLDAGPAGAVRELTILDPAPASASGCPS